MTPINISHVYCILNIFTNKRYVGSTAKHLSVRRRQHLYELRKKKHPSKSLQEEYNQYGENSIRFFVLEDVKTFDRNELFSREQYWIDFYKPEYNNNELAGNHFHPSAKTPEAIEKSASKKRGRKQSPEWIKKRMDTMKRNGKQKLKRLTEEEKKHLSEINMGERNPNWGMKRNAETRKKMSDAMAKIKVCLLSPDGVKYQVSHLANFCREHDLNYFSTRHVAIGKRKSHKGWTKVTE